MALFIKEYTCTCPVCQHTITPRHRTYGQMEALPRPTKLFKEITMDFITGLPITTFRKERVDAILVIVDRFLK